MNSIPNYSTTYTTSNGTLISSRVLSELLESIRKGEDSQRSLVDHLRDVIPQLDDDLNEAMEVYNHAEGLLYEIDPDFGMEHP